MEFIDADGGKRVGGYDNLEKELSGFLHQLHFSREYPVILTGEEIEQSITAGLGDRADEFIRYLKTKEPGSYLTHKIRGSVHVVVDNGGIDLNPANNKYCRLRNNGGEIKFHMDPAMLKQLQNAPGFVPVIIKYPAFD